MRGWARVVRRAAQEQPRAPSERPRAAKSIPPRAARRGMFCCVSFGLQRLIDQGGFTMKTSAMGSSKRVSLEELQSFKSWFDSGIAGSGQVSQEVRSLLDSPFANRRFLAGGMNPFKTEFKF